MKLPIKDDFHSEGWGGDISSEGWGGTRQP